jgi:hypothetical protein
VSGILLATLNSGRDIANLSSQVSSNLNTLLGSENRMKKSLPVPEILGASKAPISSNFTIFGPVVEG